MRDRFECQILHIKEDPFLTNHYGKNYGDTIKGFSLQAKVLKHNGASIPPKMLELQVYGSSIPDTPDSILLVDPLYLVKGEPLCTKPEIKIGGYILIKGYGFSPKKHKKLENVINKSHYLDEKGERIEFWITRRPLIVSTWTEGTKLEQGKSLDKNQINLLDKAVTSTKVEVIA